MNENKTSGKLIVIEGLDGSGKATQTKLLCDRLSKLDIEYTKMSFPNYESPSSALVKMYLGGELGTSADDVNPYAASVFYAADRCATFIKEYKHDYENGRLFISDRYSTSNAIYQTSKLPKEDWDSFLLWLEDLEYNKLEVPKPDLVIYLDMSVAVSQKLMLQRYNGDETKKDIHEKNIKFLKKCRKTAIYTAEKLGWKIVHCDNGISPRSIEDISNEIRTLAQSIISDQ